MFLRVTVFLVVIFAALFASSYESTSASKQEKRVSESNRVGPTAPQSTSVAPLVDVVDGDTLRILWRGERTLVRLIGIDAPESRENPRTERQANDHATTTKHILELAARARKQLKTLVGNAQSVRLEFDTEKKDRYGRLLAYVFVKNTMLNREMLRTGYAQLLTVPPNTQYVEEFRKAHRNSKIDKKGLWGFEGFD